MSKYIVEDTLYNRVRETAGRSPDHIAIDCNGLAISYQELVDIADRCAAALIAAGVEYGDRVAVMSPPRPEVVAALLACSKIGATFAGMGLRLYGEDLQHFLTDSKPRVIFAPQRIDSRQHADEIAAVLPDDGSQILIRLTIDDRPRLAPEFAAFISGASVADTDRRGLADSPLALIYTSGSTGKPKGAQITNLGILTSVTNALARIDIRDMRALSLLPVDHIAFLANEVVMILLSAGTMVQIAKFDVLRILETIEAKRITFWAPIPTMLQRLAASGRMDDFDLSSLDYVWWPGPLSQDAFNAIRTKARRLGVSYGMTEAAGGITFSDADTPVDRLLHTVGKPLPSLELRLDNPVEIDGREVGEILIRGRQVIQGYWNRPDATAESFTEDGWFRTGDLGAFEDGNLSIVGRKKELIRSGGYNISPYEIEAIIETHEAINFAIVVGVKDEEYGEAVVAAVSCADDQVISADDIKAHVRRNLPGYKVPKHISVRATIPFLANGKVDRKILQEQLGEEWKSHIKTEGNQA